MGLGSVALNPDNPGSGRVRACVEAVLVRHLMIVLEEKLRDVHLWSVYKEVEMPSLMLLTRMELNGFGKYDESIPRQPPVGLYQRVFKMGHLLRQVFYFVSFQ